MLCYVAIVEYSVLIMSSSLSSFRARNLSSSRVIRYDSCVNHRRWRRKWPPRHGRRAPTSPRLDRGGGGPFCRRRRCRRAVKHASVEQRRTLQRPPTISLVVTAAIPARRRSNLNRIVYRVDSSPPPPRFRVENIIASDLDSGYRHALSMATVSMTHC